MLTGWIGQMGEWNPQLFREFKSRLTLRNLGGAVVLSLVVQGLILMLGIKESATTSRLLIDWAFISTSMTWILPIVLVVGGVYLLVSDLSQEDSKGTLNFIRLSPQPGSRILRGKVVGVPSLFYLALGLALPLHVWSSLAMSVPLGVLLMSYATHAAFAWICFSLALLYALMGGRQSAGLASIVLFVSLPVLQLTHSDLGAYLYPSLYGFGNSHGGGILITQLVFILLSLFWSYWIWKALIRSFHIPGAPLLSKQQGYVLMACLHPLSLSIFWGCSQFWPTLSDRFLSWAINLNVVWILVLIVLLTPNRQTLLDWARFRSTPSKPTWNALLSDFLWGEKSPVPVSLAVNLLGGCCLWLGATVLWPEGEGSWNPTREQLLLGLIPSTLLLLLFGVLVQWILLQRVKHAAWSAMAVLGGLILFPLILIVAVYAHRDLENSTIIGKGVMLASPFLVVDWKGADVPLILSGLGVQGILIALSSTAFSRQLTRLGSSPLMEDRDRRPAS